MISAYTGLPGHGKSYGVIENVIVPACKSKRIVFTNIPTNKDLFLDRYGMAPIHFDIKDIQENPNWFDEVFIAGSLFVIDECWRLWAAGTNANKLPEKHKEFFAEHRHLVGEDGRSTEIVLVTQDLAQIASFMRSLVEWTYRVTKLNKLGASKSYRVDVYQGAVTGQSPPISKRDREILGRFKKEIYALYKSHTKSEHGAGDETTADNRFNILKSWKVKAFFIFIAVMLFLVWRGLSSVTSAYVSPDESLPENSLPSDGLINDEPMTESYVASSIQDDLIRTADKIYISYNNGRFPKIDYIFRLVFGGGGVDLKTDDLLSLGYDVTAVSQCLVVFTINKRSYKAVCEPHQEEQNFISKLASSSE